LALPEKSNFSFGRGLPQIIGDRKLLRLTCQDWPSGDFLDLKINIIYYETHMTVSVTKGDEKSKPYERSADIYVRL
jgi:hypothetical protein